MLTNKLPQIPFALLGVFERALAVGLRQPLHVAQHPLTVFTDLHAGADKTWVGAGESLETLVERPDQPGLMAGVDGELDELTEREMSGCWCHERSPRMTVVAEQDAAQTGMAPYVSCAGAPLAKPVRPSDAAQDKTSS
ncbi:hypothetical protein [Pseudomonas sp. CFBP 8772]|uniref:hypothetical protein n=1 Tax=Pseudomonas sp. CFBP 8772 TaxID=2775284 RepID=UPI001FD4B6E5|nr:hypothetical protein [Pseudomonas sp. CFBP 8772]